MQPPPVSKKSWPAAAAVSSHVPRVSAKRQTNLRLSRDHPLHSVSSNFSQCLRYVSHNLLIMVAMVPQCQCRPGGARHGAACPLAACDGACSDRIHGLTICFPIATPASASPKLVHPLRRYAFRSAASHTAGLCALACDFSLPALRGVYILYVRSVYEKRCRCARCTLMMY